MSGAGTPKAMKALASAAKTACGKAVIETRIAFGEVTLTVKRDQIVTVLKTLRDALGFQQLVDLCGRQVQPEFAQPDFKRRLQSDGTHRTTLRAAHCGAECVRNGRAALMRPALL